MNSKMGDAGNFEYKKLKLLDCLQSFFSITPTKYYHDFNRYLEDIRPDYVNTNEAEKLFLHLKGAIKFYIDNINIQQNIQKEIDNLPYNPYNSRLIDDLLHYLDNKSLKIYYRIFNLEKRIQELEDKIDLDNLLFPQTHHLPRLDVFKE